MPVPRPGIARLAALVVLALVSSLVVLIAGPAQAVGSPDLVLAKSAPTSVLIGGAATYTLTATDPTGPGAAFNVSFRDVLPVGVTYQAGSTSPPDIGEPSVLVDQPTTGQTTLIWRNAGDVQRGGSLLISFGATPSSTTLPVGSTVVNNASAYASSNPRQVARFDGTGAVLPGTFTSNADATGAPTTIAPFEVVKSEPSPEHELVRGVHDNSTVYRIDVRDNPTTATNAMVVTDLLPAGLEFLGCGGVDNSTPGQVEYAGAPRLTVVPGAGGTCLTPSSVDTVVNPSGRPAGVYTKVTWTLGRLAPGALQTITYRAGIPLRANVLAFPGGAPAPGSLRQGSNLDNNTGASTAETGSEAAYTNQASGTGTYTGPVAPGANATSTSTSTVTVTSEDLAVQKSVRPGTFAGGGVATYTLRLETSEYRRAADIRITDHVPNGVCPLSPTTNFATGAPADCAPAASFAPTGATLASATQNADGTFDLVFVPIAALVSDGVLTITYKGRMRTTYTGTGGGGVAGSPTVAGDSFTNTVSLDGTSRAVAGASPADPGPDVVVRDTSAATQASGGPAIDKKILPRAVPMTCSTGTYVDTPTPASEPAFHQGDRVCFQLRVDFPVDNRTRNAVVTDVLPDGMSYEAGSATTGTGNTVPAGQIAFNEAASAAGTADPTWTLGASAAGGNAFIEAGQILVVRFSAILTTHAAGATPDVTGNLMKLRSENSAGQAVSQRDKVDIVVTPAPPVRLLKGVRSVNGLPAAGNGPNVDGVQVRQGDEVVFRLDITNLGTAAVGNDQTVRALHLVDALPAGITCAAITLISDAGTCSDAGAAGRPAVVPATAAVLAWTLPPSDTIAPGATRPSLTYRMHIPDVASVSRVFTNTAGVTRYDAVTDIVTGGVPGTTTYFPANNLDTSIPVAQQGAPRADDTSYVVIRDVPVTKTGVTSIAELGNDGPVQSVVGELVTTTLSVTVPSRTTVFNATFSDALPAGQTFVSATSAWSVTGVAPATTPVPAGFSQNPATGRLTFPTTWTNATATNQLFTITVVARVNTLATNVDGTVLTDRAIFASTSALTGGVALPPRSATYGTTVIVPVPTLTKGDSTADRFVAAGQTVTFTLTANNAAGHPALKDASVVDCLPVGMTFGAYGTPTQGSTVAAVAGDGTNGCATGLLRLRWDVGTLLTGPATLTYTATVDPASAGLVAYTNNATLTGSTIADGANDPTTERVLTSAATDTLTVRGALLTKSAVPARPTIGERVTYTVVATLPVDVNFYDASVVDQLPAGLDPASLTRISFTCASSAGSCLGSIPGGGAALTDAAGPNGSTLQAWLLGDVLSAPQQRTLTITYSAIVRDVAANQRSTALTNTAAVQWDDTNGTDPTSAGSPSTRTSPTATATVVVAEPVLTIAKSVDDTTPEPGQAFTYTVAISNAAGGDVSAAFNVRVVDVVPVGVVVDPTTISGGGAYDAAARTITWTVPGPLAPGASTTRTYRARLAASASLTAAALVNTVTIESWTSLATAGRIYVPRPSATAAVTPSFPTLTPAKAAVSAGPAFLGQSFTWRLTMTDPGPAAAFGVDVIDVLPPSWTYDAGSARITVAGGAAGAVEPTLSSTGGVQTLRWTDLGDLSAGQAVIVTYSATPGPGAATTPGVGLSVPHTNTVTGTFEDATAATGNAGGPYGTGPATAVAHIAAADLSIDKSHVGSFTAGGTGSWDLLVRNLGPDTATGPFAVTDPLATGTTLLSTSGTGWSCTGTTTVTCTRSNAADTLASGAAFPVLTLRVSVDPAVPNGSTLSNTASVTARTYDPVPANNNDTDVVDVIASADLAIAKAHPAAVPAVAGAPFSWTLGVTNRGPSVSRAPITVTDTLPAGVAFVSATGTGWTCTQAAGVVTCVLSHDLAVGEVAGEITVHVTIGSGATGSLRNDAAVSGTTPDAVPANDTASDTVAVTAAADLLLTKDHVGAFVAGATGTYWFRVENLGPSDAAAPVRITDVMPAGITATGTVTDVTGTWTCTGTATVVCDLTGSLAAGAVAVVEIEVAIPSSATGDIANTATVSSTTTDPNPVNNTDDDHSTLSAAADLRIVKTHTGQAVAGQPLTFTLAVTNLGPSDTPGPIRVSDGLPAGLTFTSATGTGWVCTQAAAAVSCESAAGLVSGASAAPISIVVAIDGAAGPATLDNTATVQGPLRDPVPANNSSTDAVVVVDRTNVSVVKTVVTPVPPAAVLAGQNVTYTLHVTNDGPSTADTMVVTDALPAGTSLVSATGTGWTCSTGPTVLCTRATLAVGSTDITLVLRVDSTTPHGARVTNTATVATATPGDNPADNTSTATVDVRAEADLGLVKTHRGAAIDAARTVTFDLAVRNLGPSAAQRPVTVVDSLPVGMTYVSSGPDWSCTAANATAAGQTVTCVLDGTLVLDAGTDAPTLTMVAQVAADITPGNLVNTATVTSPTTDPVPSNNTGTDTVPVVAAVDLSVTKTHAGPVTVGGSVTFALGVRNAGPSVATGVVLTDTAPAGLTPAATQTSAGWTCTVAGPVVTCALSAPLAVGATSPSLSLTYAVSAAAVPSATNRAVVTSSGREEQPADNTATDRVDVPVPVVPPVITPPQPKPGDTNLVLVKTLASSTDTRAVWLITVNNRGTHPTVAPIVVIDNLPKGLTYVSVAGLGWACTQTGQKIRCTYVASLAPGATASVRLVTAITPGARDPITNTARVQSPDDIRPGDDTDTAVLAVKIGNGGTGGAGGNGGNGGTGAGGGGLPHTGADVLVALRLALLLMGAGAGALALGRRRRS